MRRTALLLLAAASFAPFAACGGGKAAPPSTPASRGPDGGTAQTSSAGSGEGSSTTTQTLGASGDLDAGPLPQVAPPVASVLTDAGMMVMVGDGGSGRNLDALSALVRAHRPDVRACYDAGRKQHPELSGKLNITVVIDPKGTATDVQYINDSDIQDPGVLACVSDIVKKIAFGPNPVGRNTIFNYRFKFTPNGG
jgi:hypothetical protein